MNTLNKVIRIGSGAYGNVFCKIEYKAGRLSITGVEGPKRNGDAIGGCGQIIMREWGIKTYAPGWTAQLEAEFRTVWDKWHLNGMQAGSPAQTAYLDANPITVKYPESHYDRVCASLAAAGLNPDPNYIHNGKPYEYGSAWLSVDVPADVLEFLHALPDTDTAPAWV